MQLLKVVVKSKTHFFLGNIVFSFRVEMNHYAKKKKKKILTFPTEVTCIRSCNVTLPKKIKIYLKNSSYSIYMFLHGCVHSNHFIENNFCKAKATYFFV